MRGWDGKVDAGKVWFGVSCFPELAQVEGLLHTLGRALISAVLPVARVTARSFVPLKITNGDLELRIFCHLWRQRRIRVTQRRLRASHLLPLMAPRANTSKATHSSVLRLYQNHDSYLAPVTHLVKVTNFYSNGHFDRDCVALRNQLHLNERKGGPYSKGSGNVQLCGANRYFPPGNIIQHFSLPSSSHIIHHRSNMIRSVLHKQRTPGI